jgi:hypothetical protein
MTGAAAAIFGGSRAPSSSPVAGSSSSGAYFTTLKTFWSSIQVVVPSGSLTLSRRPIRLITTTGSSFPLTVASSRAPSRPQPLPWTQAAEFLRTESRRASETRMPPCCVLTVGRFYLHGRVLVINIRGRESGRDALHASDIGVKTRARPSRRSRTRRTL